jgi:MSHA biogenesis protein MshP
MFPDYRLRTRSAFGAAQRGFSLVTAIFLLVVLAALGAMAVSIGGLQQSSLALDAHGVHAYQAAHTGVQWAAYQLLKTSTHMPNPCFAPSNVPTMTQSLAPFTVTVGCSETSSTEGKANRRVRTYVVTVNACNQPSGGTCPNPAPAVGYVERQLRATLHKCLDQDVGPPYSCG